CSVTAHRHWMSVATFAFLRPKASTENRFYSKRIEIIRGNDSTRNALGAIAHAQRCAHDPIDDERLEKHGIFFVIEEFGIRESRISRCAACCRIQREHAVLMRDERIRPNENSFDPTQHRGVRSNPERQAKNRQDRESRGAPKHARAEANVLEELIGPSPDAL